MSIFKGAAVAIITPMTETQEVNYEKLGELIEEQIAGGTDAIVICGTTGEASTLSHEEHLDAIKYTVEKVNHRIPVIAGTGSNSTETAIYLSQEAEKYGVDGLLLVSPYYNKATQKGLIAHFTAIADSVKVPVILYNIQGRTGVNIAPETIVYLFNNVENIVAVKEASGNISQVAKIMQLTDGKIDLYSGNDDQVVPILSLGGSGVISVLSNVAPRETHDMVQKFLDGDVAGSREIQLRALPLIDALFCEVNPIPVKAALNLMGKEVGPLRLPLTEMEPEHQAQLKQALGKATLILTWENDGTAPFYKNWPVVVTVTDSSGAVIEEKTLDWKISELMPGEKNVTTVKLDTRGLLDKARSDRNICVEIRDPMTEKAAVRLANKELDQKAQKKQMIVFKSGE